MKGGVNGGVHDGLKDQGEILEELKVLRIEARGKQRRSKRCYLNSVYGRHGKSIGAEIGHWR